ncbi:hypothetical protein KP509_15G077300 [Ceratopteris richardii]|uniref:Glabrous enhancer-binding protein-like DBD domain-containing protein n=1 Tax=Ceratopteris richardii TaxID=49495 RepID=A0A8T2T502_CERRI|nr:hypothetical protein KP509_15G077300 [Ceratopteris richardii]
MGKRKKPVGQRIKRPSSNASDVRTRSAKSRGVKKQTRMKNETAGRLEGKKGLRRGHPGKTVQKNVLYWTPAQEIVVLDELMKLAKLDVSKPLDNGDINWGHLAVTVGERLEHNLTRTQLYEKVRRLKSRYAKHKENVIDGKYSCFKTEEDIKIYEISQEVWEASEILGLSQHVEEHDFPFCSLDHLCEVINDKVLEMQEAKYMLENPGRIHLNQNEQEQMQKEKHMLEGPETMYLGQNVKEKGINGAIDRNQEQESSHTRDAPWMRGNDAVQDSYEHTEVDPEVIFQSKEKNTESSIEVPFQKEKHVLEDPGTMYLDQNVEEKGIDGASDTPWMGGSNALQYSYEHTKVNTGVVFQSKEVHTKSPIEVPFQLQGSANNNTELSHGAIKSIIEGFQSQQQALLKDLQNNCITLLKDIQEKCSSILRSSLMKRQGSWIAFGAPLSAFNLMLQRSYRNSVGDNQDADSENLSQQWKKQHLQELNLTLTKLELMLTECKKEKEKLEWSLTNNY